MARKITRRNILTTGTALALTSAAGCTDEGGNGNGDGGNGSDQSSVQLDVATLQGEEHYLITELIKPFLSDVEDRSEGSLTFQLFPGQQMGDASTYLNLVQDGTAGLAFTAPNYVGSRMYLGTVADIPFTFDTDIQGTSVYYDMNNEGILREEMHDELGTEPILAHTLTPYQVLTKDTKIESFEDFDGLTLRGSGSAQANTIEALGGSAETGIGGADVYSAIERGTIDGTLWPIASVIPWNLYEVCNYMTTNANFGTTAAIWSISTETLNSMSEEQQEILRSAGDEHSHRFAEELEDIVDDTLAELESENLEQYSLSDGVMGEIESAMSDVFDQWVDNAPSGQPAQEVLDNWQEGLESYSD